MDKAYQEWWQYHVRVARGESLTADEQALYFAGIEHFDQEEAEQSQFSSLENLRQLRSEVQTLTQNLAQLAKRSESLNQGIVELEQTYQQLTGYSLLSDARATS